MDIIAREASDAVKLSDTIFQTMEMTDAYRAVTEKMGPSPQLLAFINFDGKLGEEFGMEDLALLSPEVQHEIIMLNLNKAEIEDVALEALSDTIGKVSNWVTGAGVAGFLGAVAAHHFKKADIKTVAITGALSLGAVYAGLIVGAINTKINGVFPQPAFNRLEKAFEAEFAFEKKFADAIPSTFELGAWNNFYQTYFNNQSELSDKWRESFEAAWKAVNIKDELPTKAGWTAENFKSAIVWSVDAAEKVSEAEKTYAEKLQKIDTWLRSPAAKENKDVAKLINKMVGKSYSAFGETRDFLNEISKKLTKVGKLFKDKDSSED